MRNRKRWPSCGRKYDDLKQYCSKCGYKLERVPNAVEREKEK